METKYSFYKQEVGNCFNIIVEESIPKEEKSNGNGIRKFAYIKAGFTNEKDAEEYIKFKNMPKIDKNIKADILSSINKVLSDCTLVEYIRYSRARKAIESLESEGE